MDAAAWNAFTGTIGLADSARGTLSQLGGITNVTSLMELSLSDLEEVWKNCISYAAALRPANEADRPVFSYPARLRLLAFRLYYEYRARSNIPLDNAITEFPARMGFYLEHWKTMKDSQDMDSDELVEIPVLNKLKEWDAFKELVKARLLQERNKTLGVQLLYLIRDHDTSTQDHVRARYPSLDERFIA